MTSSTRRLFGLPALQGRRLMIPIGITAMLCLGTVHAWSIFRTPAGAGA
jgi:OFA family oxalate/formate antiporter-like MFS transporter